MENVFEIRVVDTKVSAKVLMYIKQKTNASLASIKASIESGIPFFGCGLSDDAGILKIINMYEQLLAMGARVVVLEDGEPEPIELLRNTLESHVETAKGVGLIDYLEEIQER